VEGLVLEGLLAAGVLQAFGILRIAGEGGFLGRSIGAGDLLVPEADAAVMRVVVLLAEGFEDLEFHVPLMRLQEEGADVTVAGLTTDEVAGKHGLLAAAETPVDAIDEAYYEAVVVPGGWAPRKPR